MSSQRAIRTRSCTSKKRHGTFEAADYAMRRLLRMKAGDGRLEVYRCRFCGGFHVGHARTPQTMPRRRLIALLVEGVQ